QDRVEVATVRVEPSRPATIEALRAYGVEPITLAIVPLDLAVAVPLAVAEPSGQLEIRAEPAGAGVPLYHITIRNHAARDLRAIDYEIFGGDVRFATGRRKMERN